MGLFVNRHYESTWLMRTRNILHVCYNVLSINTVMGVLSAWQKRGPGLLPRRLQYRRINFTGQKGEDSSPAITMSKERLLVLCLKWVTVILIEWIFPPDARNRMLSYGTTVVWHARSWPLVQRCERNRRRLWETCCRTVGVLERAYEVMQDRFRYR